MAPRRPRSGSNASVANASIARAPTSSPQLRKQFVLASDSIYQNNMTVLRRRDPSIVSILDQFSHVCLYHFNGQKWEKQGYEGSMFLVEHQDSPPYGLFILNRMGTGDYARRIFPEDDMEVHGDYLMYRFYPEYTKKRIELGLPYPLPPQYRVMFDREFARNSPASDQPPSPEELKKEKKGDFTTLGFWMFNTDVREPLKDVMIRLHGYVKRGEPYPEQFRYGPGRPPPNLHAKRSSQASTDEEDRTPQQTHDGRLVQHTQIPNGHSSYEMDQLLAKLQGNTVAEHQAPPANQVMQDLFAAFAGPGYPQQQNVIGSIHPAVQPYAGTAVPPQAPPIQTTARGMALLGSIFASVAPPTQAQPLQDSGFPGHMPSNQPISHIPRNLPSQPEEIQIVSPKPQSSALPQILTQNVIHSLLGMDQGTMGSRSSSAAPSSSSSRRSGLHRYEGDNELSENETVSESGFSASSTVLDDPAVPAIRGALYHIDASSRSSSRNIQGDVTPRVGASDGRAISPLVAQGTEHQKQHPNTSTTPTIASTISHTGQPLGQPRALVPFTADSELWPYIRPPLDDLERDHPSSTSADVVELDFSDTRALSDPALYKEKQQKQQGPGAGKKDKKKSRKERAADREKERAAIENGWDDPIRGQVRESGPPPTCVVGPNMTAREAQSLSTVSPTSSASQTTIPAPATNGKKKKAPSAPSHPTDTSDGDVKDPAMIAILAALNGHPQAPARNVSRKQFVQDVLSLIYSDNAFVDRLYKEYTSSS